MEQSKLSFRSLSLAAILHILLLFLLFYFTQSDDPLKLFRPQKQEQEPAVVWMPTQSPQATIPAAMQQPLAHPNITPLDKEQTKTAEPQTKPEEQEHTMRPELSHTISQQLKEPWSADRAKRAWQKRVTRASATQQVGAPATTYREGLMHKIIEGIPIEEKGVPLRQRINAQFIKDGQENYQLGLIKGICYELNKQKIMEATNNLPRKIVFKIILERDGRLIDAQFIEPSYSESFNQACLQAMWAASPYRVAPASVEGDPITLVFTLYHHPSGQQNSNVPTPITFSMN